jgi:hypothetical protein
MAEVEDLSTTDASNTARFPEAMALSAVNNGARALEGLLARHFSDINAGMLATATSTTDYTIASNKTISSYSDGLTVRAQIHSTSTGSATLNVDSVAAKNIVWNDGSQTQLGSGDLIEDQVVTFVYDLGNTVWVVDASLIDQSTAVTASSTTTFTNKTIDANGTGNSISNIETADAASGAKTGSDTKFVTGTAGTNGNLVAWNGDGDAVDASAAASDFASTWTYPGTVTLAGTADDLLTGIPSTALEIELMFIGASTDAANQAIYVRLGDASSYEATGYVYNAMISLATAVETIVSTSGFPLSTESQQDAASVCSGIMRLSRGAANTDWFASWNGAVDNAACFGGGRKSTSGALTRIQATTSGGSASFDAGTVVPRYR